jgi:hypothetical protein
VNNACSASLSADGCSESLRADMVGGGKWSRDDQPYSVSGAESTCRTRGSHMDRVCVDLLRGSCAQKVEIGLNKKVKSTYTS